MSSAVDDSRHHDFASDDDTPSLFTMSVDLDHEDGASTHVWVVIGSGGHSASGHCLDDPVTGITIRRATGSEAYRLLERAIPGIVDRFEIWSDTLEYILATFGDGDIDERLRRVDALAARYGLPNALLETLTAAVHAQATLATKDTDDTVEEYLERTKNFMEDTHIKYWAEGHEDPRGRRGHDHE